MPSSHYPSVHIPDVDLWTFIFERQEREFPDDKSLSLPWVMDPLTFEPDLLIVYSYLPGRGYSTILYLSRS